MQRPNIPTGLVASLLLGLGACGGQNNAGGDAREPRKDAARTSAASPGDAQSTTDHSIPLALWVDDVVENDTNETAKPVEVDTQVADTEDPTAFDHYFTK